LHLIDATQDNIAESYLTIRGELAAYDDGLAAKQEVVALTKCDALIPEIIEEQRAALAQVCEAPVLAISSVSKEGLQDLYDRLLGLIDAAKLPALEAAQEAAWHPLREAE